MHIRSGPFKSINRGFPYLGRGCIVILAMVFIVIAELSVSNHLVSGFVHGCFHGNCKSRIIRVTVCRLFLPPSG